MKIIEILVPGNSCHLELRQISPVLCALKNSFGVLLQPCFFTWNEGYTMIRRHAHLKLVPILLNSVQRTPSLLLGLEQDLSLFILSGTDSTSCMGTMSPELWL